MPRIRTLKPEHKQHRKVGMLTDREYRLWVGMITEADDEGRLVADAAWLRGVIFTYQPRVTIRHVTDALVTLSEVGLLRLYRVNDTPYAEFPSWRDHQHIDRPGKSKLPPYKHSLNGRGDIDEASTITREGSEGIGRDQGSDRKGGEGKGGEPPKVAVATGPDSNPVTLTREEELGLPITAKARRVTVAQARSEMLAAKLREAAKP